MVAISISLRDIESTGLKNKVVQYPHASSLSLIVSTQKWNHYLKLYTTNKKK